MEKASSTLRTGFLGLPLVEKDNLIKLTDDVLILVLGTRHRVSLSWLVIQLWWARAGCCCYLCASIRQSLEEH
ncbi:hypothetical protein ASF70_19040 [Rhizobium sp. Leaf321]|nr:hypothetical protein ASF70_19040 [Rhizobium sp. Leaf321]